jgi:hypothetical protein
MAYIVLGFNNLALVEITLSLGADVTCYCFHVLVFVAEGRPVELAQALF